MNGEIDPLFKVRHQFSEPEQTVQTIIYKRIEVIESFLGYIHHPGSPVNGRNTVLFMPLRWQGREAGRDWGRNKRFVSPGLLVILQHVLDLAPLGFPFPDDIDGFMDDTLRQQLAQFLFADGACSLSVGRGIIVCFI